MMNFIRRLFGGADPAPTPLATDMSPYHIAAPEGYYATQHLRWLVVHRPGRRVWRLQQRWHPIIVTSDQPREDVWVDVPVTYG